MKRILKTVIGVLILVTGISIFLYPNYREWKNQREISRIMEEAREGELPDPVEQEKETKGKRDAETDDGRETSSDGEKAEEKREDLPSGSPDLLAALQEYNASLITEGQDITDAWSFTEVPAGIAALNPDFEAVGYIEIPEISVSLPLYIGATQENMGKGAVVLTGTSMPVGGEDTNCVIAAHRGWGGSPYFRDIDQLKVGSEICIHNLWEDLTYQVTGTEIIPATECSILHIRQGKDMVTLFSCYPYMSPGTKYRLVICCERKNGRDTKEQEPETGQQGGAAVKELAEKGLAEKGIVMEENFMEELFRKEELLRIFLPAVCILLAAILILFRLRKRR